MADKEKDVPVVEDEDEPDLNYQPPAQKSLQEIQELDKDDESLNKYKQTLLGSGPVVADPTIPNVQVTRLTLMCDQAPGPITMDLTGDLDALKKKSFTMKEGVDYRVKIHFKVNRDIVSGLKYVHLTYRKGLRRKSICIHEFKCWPCLVLGMCLSQGCMDVFKHTCTVLM
ncbi:rho GDP-dissociation inhibitor [Pimephales promelas]|nr:rho GDP-dissociation inhibitor [Pimephales promelas]